MGIKTRNGSTKKATMRKKQNEIVGINDHHGCWTEDPLEIDNIFISYFENLFNSTNPSQDNLDRALDGIPSKVNQEMNNILMAPFTRKDIEIAIHQMFPTKAPGPDGFPALFYQKFWNTVGNKTVDECLAFLNGDKNIENWNSTNIALIPKIQNPKTVGDFRPISLCNVNYKIITKTLANRMNIILKNVISDSQSAFIKGKLITDNIIIGTECINAIRKNKFGARNMAAIKLDISKAYDRVEWAYLKEIMSRLGFNERWISLIMKCISSAEFSILINGEKKGSFKSYRGLRQGDPLSPYLFLLVAEGLSYLISKENIKGTITGLSCSKGPIISHLLFADDSLIICKAKESELLALKNILEIYELASGESINFSKSAILFSTKIDKDRCDYLSNILGVKKVDDFGKYLGVPSVFSKNRSKDFRYILDKVWNSVQGWKRNFFSIAGKEILIKSIGQAIPTYVMSVFRFPKHICDEITRSFSRFWWGSNASKKKIHWMKWDKLCLPKSLGGLNFRDIEGFNKALIAKQVWRISNNPDSLISKFLKSIYFKDSSILEADVGKNPSPLWKSLMWGKDLLSKGIRYRIGNGKLTKMFLDPWIPKEITFKPTCTNPESSNLKVADFILPSGCWDSQKLKDNVLSPDYEAIRSIPINKNLEDKLIWHYDKTGSYTVKSGYKLFSNLKREGISSSSNNMSNIWNNLWKLNIPAKIKHFCWRSLNNIIPNNVNLNKKGINVPIVCPICNASPESSDHCLFTCNRAKEIWKLTYNDVFLGKDLGDCLADRWFLINSKSSKEALGLVAVTCWAIWNDRNKYIHGESIPPVQLKSKWILDYLESYRKANERNPRAQIGSQPSMYLSSNTDECWKPPIRGVWKLNTDAACISSPPKTGMGMICRDSKGEIMVAAGRCVDIDMKAHLGELWAIFEGLKIAKSMGCSRIVVESDSKLAVQFLNKEIQIWWEVEALVESIWSIVPSFRNISFCYIPRKCNCVAHEIAQFSKANSYHETWVRNFPSWLCKWVVYDQSNFAQVAQ